MSNNLGRIRMMKERKEPNDVFETPLPVALKLIQMADIQPTDRVLDPCCGTGIFYNNIPECIKEWCEITNGRDFYEFKEKVDIVIGNPPFSQWNQWIKHTVDLQPRKIAYVMGCLNLTPKRMDFLKENGYHLSALHIVTIKGWFGNTFLCVFEKHVQPIITFCRNIYKA